MIERPKARMDDGPRFSRVGLERAPVASCAPPIYLDGCPTCGGHDTWTSVRGVVLCRSCHPPAPGAESV